MVRLKGCGRWRLSTARLCISIPYGSIKSRSRRGRRLQTVKFQFLMVRLKVIPLQTNDNTPSYFNSLWFD